MVVGQIDVQANLHTSILFCPVHFNQSFVCLLNVQNTHSITRTNFKGNEYKYESMTRTNENRPIGNVKVGPEEQTQKRCRVFLEQ